MAAPIAGHAQAGGPTAKRLMSASVHMRSGPLFSVAVVAALAVGCGRSTVPAPGAAATHATAIPRPVADAGGAAPLPAVGGGNEASADWVKKGDALSEQGKSAEAVVAYEKAVVLGPDDEESRYALAFNLGRIGRIDDAIQQYREALRILPDYAEAHNNLGTALARPGKLDEAVGHFREATSLRPDYAEAWYNLGNSYVGQGRPAEAVGPFENAMKASPGFKPAQAALQRVRAKLAAGGR